MDREEFLLFIRGFRPFTVRWRSKQWLPRPQITRTSWKTIWKVLILKMFCFDSFSHCTWFSSENLIFDPSELTATPRTGSESVEGDESGKISLKGPSLMTSHFKQYVTLFGTFLTPTPCDISLFLVTAFKAYRLWTLKC